MWSGAKSYEVMKMITKRIAGKNEGWEINIKRTKYNTTCT